MTTQTQVKIPPHSKESEMMVLGCMLTSINGLNIAANALDESDFYFNEHKTIFQVLKAACIKDKPADIHIIAEELKRQDKLDTVGGLAYLTTLAQYAGTSAFIEEYVEMVHDKSLLRKMFHAAQLIGKTALEEPAEIGEFFEESKKLIETIGEVAANQTPVIQHYTLEDLTSDLLETKEGLKTGYKELDDIVRIPNEAITLIGGRPSHGKTTFMLNLFLNLINEYPDHHFYFFSYEETRHQIALKIINILSGWIFNETQNLIQLEGYLKTKSVNFPMVEKGKEKYQELAKSGRLMIYSDPFYIQQLPSIISSLKSKVPLGAVFIDYIQKIKNKQKFGTRQLELAHTSNIILETAKKQSIPIILGAQLGRDKESKDKVKLDNIRESGDIEQDANLVLGIFNPSMEKAQDEQKQLTDRKVELKVTPLKNRNGVVNKTITLDFDRPLLKIKDGKK